MSLNFPFICLMWHHMQNQPDKLKLFFHSSPSNNNGQVEEEASEWARRGKSLNRKSCRLTINSYLLMYARVRKIFRYFNPTVVVPWHQYNFHKKKRKREVEKFIHKANKSLFMLFVVTLKGGYANSPSFKLAFLFTFRWRRLMLIALKCCSRRKMWHFFSSLSLRPTWWNNFQFFSSLSD